MLNYSTRRIDQFQDQLFDFHYNKFKILFYLIIKSYL